MDQVLKNLIEKKGTPLEVAFPKQLESNLGKALMILEGHGWRNNLFYSYKTNPVPEVLAALHRGGAGAEVVSERELRLALDLGVAPDRVVFNGIYKSPAALRTAVEQRIKCINLDAPQELDILDELAKTAKEKITVGLRVRPAVGWQGQFGHVMKGGTAYDTARRIADNKKLDFGTIHFHLGTSSLSRYCRAIDETMAFVRRLKMKLGVEIRAVDIGGGFPGKDMRLLTLWEQGWLRLWDRPWPGPAAGPDDGFGVLAAAAAYFKQAGTKYGLEKLEMWTEPGRLITGDAQLLAVKVVGLRKSGRKQYAVVDGGRVGAAGPLVGETRKVRVLGKTGESGSVTYDVVGPTCMPWDRLFAGVSLPRLEPGDILLIEGAGAYFVPMETEFSFDRPRFATINDKMKF